MAPARVRPAQWVSSLVCAVVCMAAAMAPAAVHAQLDCATFATSCPLYAGHLAAVHGLVLIGLPEDKNQYFTTSVTKESTDDVIVEVASVIGTVEVFVAIGEEPTHDSTYTSIGSAHAGRVVIPASALAAGANDINVEVYATSVQFGVAVYTLMVTETGLTVTVTNGVSVRGAVGGGYFQYYEFESVSSTQELDILLTPLVGDPDLFVSTTQPKPSHADYQWASRSRWGDTVEVPSVPETHSVYMSVYGHREAMYTLVVRQGVELLLFDGLAQHDSTPAGVGRYYAFNVGKASESMLQGVSFDVFVQQGDVDIYVLAQASSTEGTVLPVVTPPRYNYSSSAQWYRPMHLSIGPGDPGFLSTSGRYHVLVVGKAAHSNFTVFAASRAGITTLRDGTGQPEDCRAGEYEYFKFVVNNRSLDVDIVVTPLSGDPDVYVSCTSDPTHTVTGYPSRYRGHYYWASMQAGVADSIHIAHDAPHACANQDGGGTYYIAVYGYQDSTFSIVASTDNGMANTLVDGMPQHGVVARQGIKLYQFYLDTAAGDLTLSLTALAGDPDLFVNVGGDATPTVNIHQYASVSSSGRDGLLLPGDDLCTQCWVRMAVFGYSPAEFVISATTSQGYRTLQDGVPVRDHVEQNDYMYFKYLLTETTQTLNVVLTTLSGDADLYVSMVHQHPGTTTMFNQTWFSLYNAQFDAVAIPNAATGVYYIGVRGHRNSTFTIVAHASAPDEAEMVQLVMGQPQMGAIYTAETFSYYVVKMTDRASTLTVAATPFSGQIGVYINLCTQSTAKCDGADGGFDSRPNLVNGMPNATWSSDASISRESVQIPHAGCDSCSYVIGVFGHTPANFSVTAVTSDSLMVLQQGVPHRDTVARYQYRYYMLTLSEPHQDVIITLTAFTGDPDLFVTACDYALGSAADHTCNDRPTNFTHQWQRRSFGSDSLVIPYGSVGACEPSPATPCDYYIGVLGWLPSSFSIMATLHSDRPSLLVDGVPQVGHVNASVSNQYVLDVLPGREYVSVTVTPSYGDADVFVTLDMSKPGPTHWDYRAIGAVGTDRVVIQSSDPQYQHSLCHPTVPCRIFIAVYGFHESLYTITAVTDRAATVLQANVPVSSSVLRGEFVYFRFSVDLSGTTISFVVTPVNGDPDIYIGVGDLRRPTNHDYIWAAARTGQDVVDIYPDDDNRCEAPCNYYIGVRGFHDTTFTIVAKQKDSSPTMLVDGLPTTGFLNQSQTAQYMIHVPPHQSGIDIVLSPMFGDGDLFVTLDGSTPTLHNRQYVSNAAAGDDRISIRAYDAKYLRYCGLEHVCPVRIAVRAFTQTQYNLVATTSNSSTLLLANVPMRDVVFEGGHSFFVFHNDQPGAAISIVLTPVTGDPDMFVSTTNPRPTTRSNSQWSAMRLGGDVLDIYPGQQGACIAPCNYYIGVTAYRNNASFVILAGNHSNAAVRLSNGVPQLGFVGQGRTKLYTAHMLPHQPYMEIAITPRVGDPDVYVTLGTDQALPSKDHYDYRSMASWGQDVITIDAANSDAYSSHCDLAMDCVVNIAVVGFRDAEYSIVATTLNGLQHLQAGVPSRDNVEANEYEYFVFTPTDLSRAVVFTLTSFGGDPDMYISITNPRPTKAAANHTWKSDALDYDIITIQPTAAGACTNVHCRYYIGVTGYDQAASFQLLARMADDGPPTVLIQGQPQAGHVEPRELDFFTFRVADAANDSGNITFSVTSLNSPAAVYVVPQKADGTFDKPSWQCLSVTTGPHGVVCQRYGVVGAMWSSDSSLTGGAVRISASDPNRCTGCLYLVGIAPTTTQPSDFLITAAITGGITTLQDGVPTQDNVRVGEYKYYQLVIDEPRADVSVSLTNFLGRAELYLSTTNHRPTNGINAFQWRSYSFLHDMVYIQYNQLTDCEARVEVGGSCVMYIGVYGRANAAFAVTASLDQTFTAPVQLLDGVPIVGFVNQSHYQYYTAHVVAPPNSRVLITITPVFGDPDLYVTTDGSQPGKSNWNFRSVSWGGVAQDSVSIEAGKPHYCNDCMVRIAVYGFMQSQYTIAYTTESTIARLVDGEQQQGYVTGGSYKYYRFAVPADQPDVTFFLTPLSGGSPRLVASPLDANERPTLLHNQWSAGEMGDNILYIPATASGACTDCSYVVGVFAMRNTTFFISASLSGGSDNRVTFLVDGQPQASAVSQGGYSYFAFSSQGDVNGDTSFRVAPRSGNVEMYITNEYTPGTSSPSQLPSTSFYLWSTMSPTAGSSRYTITVGPSSPGFDISRPIYTIAIYGLTQATFEVSASSADISQTIALGAPSNHHSVARGAMVFFNLYMSRNDGDLKIGVTPLSGNPQLVVSTQHGRPTCSFGAGNVRTCVNYTWASTTAGVDVVAVPANQYTADSTFYIGVFGETDALFSISAWADSHTALTDGHPQISSTSLTTLCPIRMPYTGACMEPQTDWYKRQAAFFSFQIVSQGSDVEPKDVAITVNQPCVFDDNKRDQCGDELELFVIPCNAGTCAPEDWYPSSRFSRFRQIVYDGSATIFIPREHPDFCDPRLGLCNYYVGVYPVCSGTCDVAAFQISYSTAAPQLIAHSCMDGHVCSQPDALVAAGGKKAYEMYVGESPVDLHVRVEACTGAPALYMCTSQCTDPFNPGPGNSQWDEDTTTGVASVTIAAATGTYYADVIAPASGSASVVYQLSAATGSVPTLDIGTAGVAVGDVSDSGVTLSWSRPKLVVPGTGGSQTIATAATAVQYTLYRAAGGFPSNVVKTTSCGLASHANTGGAPPAPVTTDAVSVAVGDLEPSTTYEFSLVATCGAGCMPDGQAAMSVVFPAQQAKTAGASMSTGTILLIVLCVVLVPAVILTVYCYRRNKKEVTQQQYDMVDVSGMDAVVSQPVTNYKPLLDDGGDDNPAPSRGSRSGGYAKLGTSGGRGSLASRVAARLGGKPGEEVDDDAL